MGAGGAQLDPWTRLSRTELVVLPMVGGRRRGRLGGEEGKSRGQTVQRSS